MTTLNHSTSAVRELSSLTFWVAGVSSLTVIICAAAIGAWWLSIITVGALVSTLVYGICLGALWERRQ